MHSAEVAVARAQAAADGKREVEKEVAEIKKYKDFRERNEEIYKIALELAEKAREKEDYRTAATCLAQAVAATGQIKPLTTAEGDKGPQPESGFLKGYMAKADAFYGNDQQTGIPVDTTKPETRADTILVDSGKS